MKKLRFTQTTFEVSDVIMSVLTRGMCLQFLKGHYPSMELFAEQKEQHEGYTTTVSYAKLVCDAADERFFFKGQHDGGKAFDMRFKLLRIHDGNYGFGLPRYLINVWYRKDAGEIVKERFYYDRNPITAITTSPIEVYPTQEQHEVFGNMNDQPPAPIAFL